METNFYKQLIKDSPLGYAFHKMLYDENGQPSDYEFIEVNDAFETFTGLQGTQIVGKTLTEVLPEILTDNFDWIKIYGDIALNGGIKEFEQFSSVLNHWYKIKVSSPQKNYFITIFSELTKEEEKLNKLSNFYLEKSDLMYKTIYEQSPIGIALIDNITGQYYQMNSKFTEIVGRTRDELLTLSWMDITHPDDVAEDIYNVDLLTSGQIEKYSHNKRYIKPDGSIVWIKMNVVPILEVNNLTRNHLTIIDDITESKKAEEALVKSEEKYRLITENASDVIWVLNLAKNKFTYFSPSVYTLSGYTVEEALNSTLDKFLTPKSLLMVSESIKKNIAEFVKNPTNPIINLYEVQQVCKDGTIIWVEVSNKYKYNMDNEIEVIGVSRNIEERKKIENQVLYLSYHDQLTNLYNRRFYEEEIKRLDTERNLPLALIIADVNGLKLTNDAFGHAEGDILLRTIADIVKNECRADEIVARTGGDEFIILLPKTDSDGAINIITRIRKSLASSKSKNFILSLSMGFTVKNNGSENIDEINKEAEDNMYKEKLTESLLMKRKTIDLIMHSLYGLNKREMIHSNKVSEISIAIAKELHLDKDEIEQVKIAGLMHDIGNIGINNEILNKPESLTPEEWVVVKRHSEIGYRILSSINELSETAEYVLAHHEKWDGSGYPKGIPGNKIPRISRIISVADAFDAMTSNQSYRKALSIDETVSELKNFSGIQFDSEIVDVFINKVLKKFI